MAHFLFGVASGVANEGQTGTNLPCFLVLLTSRESFRF
jgi:hypothetical protein